MGNNLFKKVTLKDIAQKTGYTINTVSHALKDKSDISAAAKKLIHDAADELGYIGNSVAESLRTGYTRTLALILGDIANPHFSIMVKETEQTARKYQYNTIIFNTDEDPEQEFQAIRSALGKKVDGMILCPTQQSHRNIQFLKQCGIPFLLIGRSFAGEDTGFVVLDDEKGGYLATKHLLEKGHKRILHLSGPAYISSAKQRKNGYLRALKEWNIQPSSSLVYETDIRAGNSLEDILGRVLEEKIIFTAAFAFSDMLAFEAMYLLQKQGISVPKDISIVGFDNIQRQLLVSLPLTTIASQNQSMASVAAEDLIRMIEDKDIHASKRVLDVKLIERSSVYSAVSMKK